MTRINQPDADACDAMVFVFDGESGIKTIYLAGLTATDKSPAPLLASSEGAAAYLLAGWQQAQGGGSFAGQLFPFDKATEAFQFMWDNSFETRTKKNGKTYKVAVREVAAWITKEGILVQPWKGPLVDKNGKVIAGYAANHIVRGEGAYSYNNFLPFDQANMTVTFNGRILSIIGQIHTHPLFGPTNSNQDNSLSGQLGIPIYYIHGSSIYDSSGVFFGTISSPSKSIFGK